MQNWDELDETGHCPSEADYISMQKVCQSLSIPHSKVSFVKEYWNSVFRFIVLCVIEYVVKYRHIWYTAHTYVPSPFVCTPQ